MVLLVLPLKKQTTNSDLYVTAVLGMSKEEKKKRLNFGRIFLMNRKKETYLRVWWGLVGGCCCFVFQEIGSEIGKNKVFVKDPAWCFLPKLVLFTLLTLAGSLCTFNYM